MHENDELTDVLAQLSVLEPLGVDAMTSPHQQLLQLKQVAHTPVQRRNSMILKRFTPFAVIALMVVALITMPSARVLASNFLGLFRVQKFAPISVSPQQLEKLGQLSDTGLFPAEIINASDYVEPEKFDTYEDAQLYMTQLERPTWVSTFHSLGEPDDIIVEGAGSAEMIVNLANARGILDAVDADPKLLPDSLDGATINVNIHELLVQEWQDEKVILVQTVSPEFGYPEDVDPAVIGEAILLFLGMDDTEAYRVSRNIDWTTTVVLPIPAEFGTFSEVAIRTTTGLAIESLDGNSTTLLWQENGLVNVLIGGGELGSADTLLDLIENGDFH